jgi:prepilin-type processing-associated H-X9-DG protein
MYADLNSRRCPDAGFGKLAHEHFNLLTNVTASGPIFSCPSDRFCLTKAEIRPGNGLSPTNLSYGFVPGLIWQDQPDSILMFDRGLAGVTAGSRWLKSSPHGERGGSVAFGDSHVEFKEKLPSSLGNNAARSRY